MRLVSATGRKRVEAGWPDASSDKLRDGRRVVQRAPSHFGLGVTLLGIVAVTAWGSERIAEMKVGESLEIAR